MQDNETPETPEIPEPVVPEVKPEVPEVTPEPEAPETPEVPAVPVEPEDDEDTQKTGFERRVDKLTKKREQAEQEAAYWRQEALKQHASAPAAPEEKEPEFSDFNDIELYTRAVAEHHSKRAVKVALQEFQQQNQGKSVLDTYNQRVQEFKRETPDFDAVFEDLDDVQLAPELTQGILESPNGPRLAYHLAKNLGEVKKLNAMTPYQRLMALGRLEASLETKTDKTPVKRVSAAPGAPKVPNPSASGTKSEDQMSPAEWIAMRNKQDKTLRHRR